MGQAFDRDGNVLGETFGATKREVFDALMKDHADAASLLIRKLHEADVDAHLAREENEQPDPEKIARIRKMFEEKLAALPPPQEPGK